MAHKNRLLPLIAQASLLNLFFPQHLYAQSGTSSFFNSRTEAQKCLDILHDAQTEQITMAEMRSYCDAFLSREKLFTANVNKSGSSHPYNIILFWHPRMYANAKPLERWMSKYLAFSNVAPLVKSCLRKDGDYVFMESTLSSIERHSGNKIFLQAYRDACQNLTSIIAALPNHYLMSELEDEVRDSAWRVKQYSDRCERWYLLSTTPFLAGSDGKDGVLILQDIIRDGGYVPLPVALMQEEDFAKESQAFAEVGQPLPPQRVAALVNSYKDGGIRFCMLALARLNKANADALEKGLRPTGKFVPVQPQ